jgi:hypothetical protein
MRRACLGLILAALAAAPGSSWGQQAEDAQAPPLVGPAARPPPGPERAPAAAPAAWTAPPGATTTTITRTTRTLTRRSATKRRLGPPPIGFMADAGVPDGALVSLVVRPAAWVRLHGGAGTNTISPGFRGGLSFVPFGVGPSLNLEVGHCLPGDANGLIRRALGIDGSLGPLFRRTSYTYGNAHLGLELGRRAATFFVHGGFTYARATLGGAEERLAEDDEPDIQRGATSVNFFANPTVRVLTPSVKIGVIVYLQ